MSDIVISGYYGLGNSGDEALLKSIIEDLRRIKPDVSITALSGNVKLTKEQYGIRTINRYNVFAVFNALRKAKLLISGGGTLIQDATSTKSLLYYLSIISVAKKQGAKVMLYANGMGPIKDKNIGIVSKVLNKVDLITLRESESMQEIKRCGIIKPKVVVTADPAFNLKPVDEKQTVQLMKRFSIPAERKLLAVSVRSWHKTDELFEKKMACVLDKLAEDGYFPVFIPMQMSADLELSKRISEQMKAKSALVDSELTAPELLSVIGKCDIACGMRLHLLIFASVMNVPMTGIVYDPKIRGFMEYMNQCRYVEIENFDDEKFYKLVLESGKNSALMRKELETESVPLREKAKENARMAIELLDS